MARIRTIKSEFFTSEDVIALSPLARLLYIGLWCEADREGRMKWTPVSFRYRYLPADACDIQAVAGELVARGLVVLYGHGLAYIPSFLKHQRPNPREQESVLPEPPEPVQIKICEPAGRENLDLHASNPDLHAQGGREGKGREGNGNGGEGVDADASAPPPTPAPPRSSEVPFVPRDAWLQLAECWNQAVRAMPIWARVDTGTLPKTSQATLLKALRECPDIAAWEARFARAAKSEWLTGRQPGRDGQVFVADLWWLLENVSKLDSGRYDTREKVTPRSREQAEQDAIWARFEAQAKAKAVSE